MRSRATKREILEKNVEKRLQDPKTEPLISLPLDFLEDITCGFSTERELGRGACGVVYKGVLQSGKAIAVKKIFDTHLLGNDNQVENEIICLTEVNHQNVVQLLGYCVETKSEVVEHGGKHVMAEKRACLLCFEFLCNGSLDKHLSDGTSDLDWDERYKIIIGVCRGLHYLHDKRRIAHRDLKPQNILMDDTMLPKIADFDLSRLLSQEKSRTVTAKLQGTPGYMAPECIEQRSISFEADIFSLGVIIIEIITGHRDYPSISERTEMSIKQFTDEVVGSWRNRLIEITPTHMSLEIRIQQVQQCISIALKCLEPESNKRPTSLDIVQSLNAVETKCTPPGNLPSVVEKDMRNQNLQGQVNVNIINIPKTISAINGLNECTNLFQWVTLAISSQEPQLNETRKEKLQGDVWQLQGDLQCLSDTLPAKYNLIDRAEWRIHEHYVAELLSRLKDAVYDAEDLLDEFRWYEKKVSVDGNATLVEPIIDFFNSVTRGSFNKVTDIQKRLNYLSRELEKIGLLQAMPRFDKTFRPETTSFPIEPEIVGRDNEKKNLIRMLGVPTDNNIHSNEATITSVPVLPIVGIGGVGKTTLAQHICNNSEVKRHFKLIIWICVSDDFDVKRLTKEAIEQSSGEVQKNDNLNFLQGALANSLKTKRFLLVLDDMWSENDLDWKRFCAPFRNVLQGSMMLVTTRSLKVANVVGTMDPFPLEGLDEDVFRKFFKQCVFGYDSCNNDPELERIGEKILPKLKRSPLAAKTIGRLLGMSLDPTHWDRILKSHLWELQQKETDILPALRLSYMYLPFYLKRCFSFCAIYPKDYNFRKEKLAEIWVAEGFVQHQPNVSLQHTGGQYIEELAHLSFFQKHPRMTGGYVIHDLMHDMAQLVSKDECYVIKDRKDFQRIPKNVLHLSVLSCGDVKCSDLLNLCHHKKLRTLFCYLSLKSETGSAAMEKWCTELLCMRVMVCFSISKSGLPDSISNMNHLRYLEILNSCLCKRPIPAAFSCLYNMQILYANQWDIDNIPIFDTLINLQKFVSAKIQFHCIHSADIHEGATDEGQIRQLKFIEYNSEDLPRGFHPQNLTNITSLWFQYLDNIKSITCPMSLMQIHSYDDSDNTFSSLADVQIRNCKNLSSLEQFLQPAYVPVIKKIEISHCGSLESVPTERFGDLRFLEVLRVSQCPRIKSRRLFAPSLKELYLTESGNLGCKIECCSLTILHLSNCPLESIELQMCNLPLLQELKISFCPFLTVIRDSESNILSSDILHSEARSRAVDNTFLPLTDVEMTDCSNLSCQEQFIQPVCLPTIMKIEISNCRSLKSIPTDKFGYFRFLEVLNVSHCPKIKSRHLFAPSLKKLYLEDSGELGYKIECNSLTILHLSKCSLGSIELQMWNLRLLQELEISNCPSLSVIGDSELVSSDILHGDTRSRATGNTFSSLTAVQIRNCQNLSSLEQFLQPSYVPIVKKIEIYSCRCLESVLTERFRDLCFLEVLRVFDCPMIKQQRLFVPSLKELYLTNSGNLRGNIECSSLTTLKLSDCLLEAMELQAMELQVRNLPLPIIRDSEPISTDLFHGGATKSKMGKFPLLAHLTIISCEKLKTIDGLLCLPAVERIWIVDCGLLSLPAHTLGSFPRLKELGISNCQSLNWQSRLVLPWSLQNLTLQNCGDFSSWLPSCLENLTSLESLEIHDCECIVSIPGHLWSSNLRSLQWLKLYSCSKLKSIGGPGAITHIRDLYIDACPELKEIDQPLWRRFW